jgi:hypothetical protein
VRAHESGSCSNISPSKISYAITPKEYTSH